MSAASSGPYVTVIGGAGVDVVGRPSGPLLDGESNPGTVRISSGGVGRNIAENLSRLGIATRLVTVIGNDRWGESVMADCLRAGVDMAHAAVVDGVTSTYLAILDRDRDLRLAVSQLDLLEAVDHRFVSQRAAAIGGSSLVILDANLRASVIDELFRRFARPRGGAVPFFVDTVSVAKARRLGNSIRFAHTIKANRSEAEALAGMTIADRGDLSKALGHFLELGVERVFITLGGEGLFYGDSTLSSCLPGPALEPVNTTGCGDAAMAALAYGYLQQMSLEECARLSLSASALALTHEHAAHPGMSIAAVERTMKELGLCGGVKS